MPGFLKAERSLGHLENRFVQRVHRVGRSPADGHLGVEGPACVCACTCTSLHLGPADHLPQRCVLGLFSHAWDHLSVLSLLNH